VGLLRQDDPLDEWLLKERIDESAGSVTRWASPAACHRRRWASRTTGTPRREVNLAFAPMAE
jgi:hypothetical protein